MQALRRSNPSSKITRSGSNMKVVLNDGTCIVGYRNQNRSWIFTKISDSNRAEALFNAFCKSDNE